MKKRILDSERLRKIPSQFSWVDHRLVSEAYLSRCEHPAWALYLFLITVADVHGLSYYGDDSLCKRLSMSPNLLSRSRGQLIDVGLLAYQAPLYQVLALGSKEQGSRIGQHLSVAEILHKAMGGVS